MSAIIDSTDAREQYVPMIDLAAGPFSDVQGTDPLFPVSSVSLDQPLS
jgi:hypothetical protein